MKIKDSFHFYAIITILFGSSAYVFTRLALQYFDVFSLGFLRYFIASLTLLIVAITLKLKLPQKKDLFWFLLSGLVGFFLYIIFFNKGQSKVTAATASIVIATVPVITAFCANFVYKEKLRVFQWIAILIQFIGVGILTLMNGKLSINSGLFWMLGAAFMLSGYSLIQRKLTKKYEALTVTTFSIFFGTFLLSGFASDAFYKLVNAPLIQLLCLFVLGVCSCTVSCVAWTKAFALAKKTSQVTNYMFLTPFLTSILGFLLIKEIPDKTTLLGGGVILFGLFVFNFGEYFYKQFIKEEI